MMRIVFPQYDYEYMECDIGNAKWIAVHELFPALPFEKARQVDKIILRKDDEGFYNEIWLI